MNEREWQAYLRALEWECPQCGSKQVGAREQPVGRVTARCGACRWHDLLYIWGGDGWIFAPSAGIILEQS